RICLATSEAVTLTFTTNVSMSPTSTLPAYVQVAEEGDDRAQPSALWVKASPRISNPGVLVPRTCVASTSPLSESSIVMGPLVASPPTFVAVTMYRSSLLLGLKYEGPATEVITHCGGPAEGAASAGAVLHPRRARIVPSRIGAQANRRVILASARHASWSLLSRRTASWRA